MSCLDGALTCAERGWAVFPCKVKRPLTEHGLHDATTDRDQIKRWWRRWPDANLAIRTGLDSLLVIDVDGDDGTESLRRLEREHGELPRTASVKTPSGGSHFYFRHPGGEISSSVGRLGLGLDIRADGGYVVVPPSPGYVFDEEAPVVEPPEWLVGLMGDLGRDGSAPKVGQTISKGERNTALASLAGTMRRRGMGEEEILAALKVTNATRCMPPLAGSEVGQIVASIVRYEPEQQPEAQPPATELLIDMAAAMKLADEPIDYPIEPIAARGFLTVLAGRHSSFKTWLMLVTGHVCHYGEVAHGGRGRAEVAGLRCDATKTLYVDAENGPRLLGRRFRDAGIPADGLLVADGTKLHLPRDLDRLRGLIEETGAGLVVLDSLRRLTPGIRENESDDMAALIADLGTMARELDIAIVLIHHRSTKKGAATLRGSSSIEDQADLVFALERVDGDSDPKRRRLKAVKYRIDAEPPPIWMRMGGLAGAGRFAVEAADRFEGDDADDEQGADEQLAERIDALADQVRRDDGWTPARLAAAVGSGQRSGTFQRALRMLLARGWQSQGSTRDRLLRPPDDSRHSYQPLGDGVSGAKDAASEDPGEEAGIRD